MVQSPSVPTEQQTAGGRRLVRGGRNVYGQAIGILMLETGFPRIPGDIGNATTFDFPVLFRVVEGALPQRLVLERDPALLTPFVEAARELERVGVRAITTSCGFLALFHRQMADAVSIPVFSSALIQVPLVHQMLRSGQRVGILTANRAALTEEHYRGVGWSSEQIPVHVTGLEGSTVFRESHFYPERYPLVDFDAIEAEVLTGARRLVDEAPDVGAIVLECTNLPQHAAAIQRETGRPVFDIVTLMKMVYRGVVQQEYVGYM
jgi:Asp/Glu/hydantoin racemase